GHESQPAGPDCDQSEEPARGSGHRRGERLLAPASTAAGSSGRMLMMSRRQGETILIGGEIEIVIAHIGRSRVKVGIRAPRRLPVVAREMKLVSEENLAAAGTVGLLACKRGRSPLQDAFRGQA